MEEKDERSNKLVDKRKLRANGETRIPQKKQIIINGMKFRLDDAARSLIRPTFLRISRSRDVLNENFLSAFSLSRSPPLPARLVRCVTSIRNKLAAYNIYKMRR